MKTAIYLTSQAGHVRLVEEKSEVVMMVQAELEVMTFAAVTSR